jgi:hypothetical protein
MSEKTTIAMINSNPSFMMTAPSRHKLEIDAETQYRGHPDRGEQTLFPVAVEPQVSRYAKRNDYGE